MDTVKNVESEARLRLQYMTGRTPRLRWSRGGLTI